MNLKNFLPLLFFSVVCFSMARCAAVRTETTAKSPAKQEYHESKEDRIRRSVVLTASKYLGTKYKSAGKCEKGFDCSGFVYFVLEQENISLPGSSATQESYGKHVQPAAARPGDLIFFRRSKGGRVFHVGIVAANGKNGLEIIHSTSSRGVVRDNLSNNSYWTPKISTARDVIAAS